jgi:hypothetical protein
MKWILVVIFFINGEPVVQNVGEFPTIEDCFWAREWTIDNLHELDEFDNPINGQSICVRVKDLDRLSK